ncbi:MAG: gliding motility-associated C-terminal domain-containing protein, partial [Candidatus Eiseniibacteriota bacterium]
LNLQNLVIFIDSQKGGATTALPNRYADVAKWDAWEYALVAEGWWKGVLVSNGSNDLYSWAKRKADTDFWFCTNHVDNSLDLHVRKEVLGNPTESDIRSWDIIAIISGHDGASSDENFGALRWVNEGSPTEWQFGGGLNGEGGRERDANIIDVAVSAGENKSPGRSQEDMLNYTTEEANSRFRKGEMAVILEATKFEDLAPPAISPLPSDGKAVTEWFAMENAPLVIGTDITDGDQVLEAFLKWRPLRGAFVEPVRMSRLLRDLWVADIDFSAVRSAVTSVEGKLYFELQLSARDPSNNTAESRLFTAEVDTLRRQVHLLADVERFADSTSDDVILQGVPNVIPEGSALVVPRAVFEVPSKVYDLVFSSLGGVDLSQLPLETGPFTGVARRFELIERDSGATEGIGPPVTETAVPLSLLLHYPSYAAGNSDTRGFTIYRWQDETYRWILMGGNASSRPGLVSVSTSAPGTYAIFADRFEFDVDRILSTVTISPNPFSPNGDGLYEETHVSFYLQKPTNVLIEIYDLAGQLVRRFERRYFEELGRIEGLTWDGKDSNGKVVPYGIYVMRFEAAIPDQERSERFNKAVVVIK